MSVLVVDYGAGNIHSVLRAVEACGAKPFLSKDPCDILAASHIILPGVGSYADGIEQLRNAAWVDALKNAVSEQKKMLGICLGMQLLSTQGEEDGVSDGLDLIPGAVSKLEAGDQERIPHVGWNEVCQIKASPLFEGIRQNEDFYFVHSYHYRVATDAFVSARTSYGGEFVSAVEEGAVYGVQFHPEKSGKPGLQLIKNFLNL